MSELNKLEQESKLRGLEKLKARVFGKSPKEKDILFRFCEIIQFCGGYPNFRETPIATIMEISKSIDRIHEQEEKMWKASRTKVPARFRK